jgi:cytochrome oxidase assembly protein ShyY1
VSKSDRSDAAVGQRQLLKRWFGLTLLALLLIALFVRLGVWQLARAHRPSVTTLTGSAVPLDQVSQMGQALPDSAIGRLVEASGTYDPTHQEVITGRTSGRWILTPLRLPDGSALAVVRGWVALGQPAPTVPSGRVVVTGTLQASENPAGRPSPPSGTLASVTTEQLVARWPYSIHDGFLILTEQLPASALAQVPVPTIIRTSGLRWQNTLYAVQWWIFAAFVVFFWIKVITDDRRGRIASGTEVGEPTADGV